MELTSKKCVACEGGIPNLKDNEIKKYLKQVNNWNVEEKNNHKQITKEFKFRNFKEAMKFVNKVADIAESEGHHPDIYIDYNKVILTLFTHAINGLHENDFIVAAKIDKL